jgi:hypothetical protein
MNARKEFIRIAIAVLLLAACLLMPGQAEPSAAKEAPKAGLAMLIENIQRSVMGQANAVDQGK